MAHSSSSDTAEDDVDEGIRQLYTGQNKISIQTKCDRLRKVSPLEISTQICDNSKQSTPLQNTQSMFANYSKQKCETQLYKIIPRQQPQYTFTNHQEMQEVNQNTLTISSPYYQNGSIKKQKSQEHDQTLRNLNQVKKLISQSQVGNKGYKSSTAIFRNSMDSSWKNIYNFSSNLSNKLKVSQQRQKGLNNFTSTNFRIEDKTSKVNQVSNQTTTQIQKPGPRLSITQIYENEAKKRRPSTIRRSISPELYDRLCKEKDNCIEQKKQVKLTIEESGINECTFQPNLCKGQNRSFQKQRANSNSDGKRTFEQFYKEQVDFIAKKENEIQQKILEQQNILKSPMSHKHQLSRTNDSLQVIFNNLSKHGLKKDIQDLDSEIYKHYFSPTLNENSLKIISSLTDRIKVFDGQKNLNKKRRKVKLEVLIDQIDKSAKAEPNGAKNQSQRHLIKKVEKDIMKSLQVLNIKDEEAIITYEQFLNLLELMGYSNTSRNSVKGDISHISTQYVWQYCTKVENGILMKTLRMIILCINKLKEVKFKPDENSQEEQDFHFENELELNEFKKKLMQFKLNQWQFQEKRILQSKQAATNRAIRPKSLANQIIDWTIDKPKIIQSMKTSQRQSPHLRDYSNGRLQRQEIIIQKGKEYKQKLKEKQEQSLKDEIKECTFKPKINNSINIKSKVQQYITMPHNKLQNLDFLSCIQQPLWNYKTESNVRDNQHPDETMNSQVVYKVASQNSLKIGDSSMNDGGSQKSRASSINPNEGEEVEKEPVLFMDVKIGNKIVKEMVIYQGEDPKAVVTQFCDQNKLGLEKRKALMKAVDKQMQTALPILEKEEDESEEEDSFQKSKRNKRFTFYSDRMQ